MFAKSITTISMTYVIRLTKLTNLIRRKVKDLWLLGHGCLGARGEKLFFQNFSKTAFQTKTTVFITFFKNMFFFQIKAFSQKKKFFKQKSFILIKMLIFKALSSNIIFKAFHLTLVNKNFSIDSAKC